MPDNVQKYINSQLNGDFKKLSQGNPYNNPEIPYDIWDGIGDLFGFSTKEDKLRLQYQQSAREYDAQLLQNQREEAYNSESAQAQRLRQAGINPDLQGVSPGQASEFDNQAVGSQPDFSNVGTSLADVANFALQGVQVAQGLANFVSFAFDLNAKFHQNKILESDEKTAEFNSRIAQFNLNEKISGFAKSFAHDVYMSLPDDVRRDDDKLAEHIKNYATLNGIDNAEDLDNFHKYAQLYARNLENERDVAEAREQLETSRRNAIEQTSAFGSYFANSDDVYQIQEMQKGTIKLMSDLFYQQLRDSFQTHKNSADYGAEVDKLDTPQNTAYLEGKQLDTESKRSDFENKRIDVLLQCAEFYVKHAQKLSEGGFIAQQAAQGCMREANNIISGGPSLIGSFLSRQRQNARDFAETATDMVKVIR